MAPAPFTKPRSLYKCNFLIFTRGKPQPLSFASSVSFVVSKKTIKIQRGNCKHIWRGKKKKERGGGKAFLHSSLHSPIKVSWAVPCLQGRRCQPHPAQVPLLQPLLLNNNQNAATAQHKQENPSNTGAVLWLWWSLKAGINPAQPAWSRGLCRFMSLFK